LLKPIVKISFIFGKGMNNIKLIIAQSPFVASSTIINKAMAGRKAGYSSISVAQSKDEEFHSNLDMFLKII